MARVLMAAVFATIFAAGWVVGTQTVAGAEDRPGIGHGASSGVDQQVQMRASKLLGSPVYNARNAEIGEVKEILLDKDGRVAVVVIDVAFVGFGDIYVAVSLADISDVDNQVTLNRTTH